MKIINTIGKCPNAIGHGIYDGSEVECPKCFRTNYSIVYADAGQTIHFSSNLVTENHDHNGFGFECLNCGYEMFLAEEDPSVDTDTEWEESSGYKIDDKVLTADFVDRADIDLKTTPIAELTSSEAIMAFITWLTTRKEKVSFGANEECSVAVELFTEFTDHNNMPYLRANYTDYFTMPKAVDEKLEKRVINPIGERK